MTPSLQLVTGKGGVGKTRVATLMAREFSADLIGDKAQIEQEAKKMRLPVPVVHECGLAEAVEDFFLQILKVDTLARWAGKSSLLQNLLHLAPNLEELLIFHQWVLRARQSPQIVDAPSTGTFLSMCKAVKTALQMFEGGKLRKIAEEIDGALREPGFARFVVVSLPENSALQEMKELQNGLKTFYPDTPSVAVINRLHPFVDTETPILPGFEALATERPKRERERMAPYSFWRQLEQGATQLSVIEGYQNV